MTSKELELTSEYLKREDAAIAAITALGYEYLYTYTPDGQDRRTVFGGLEVIHGLTELESMAFRLSSQRQH